MSVLTQNCLFFFFFPTERSSFKKISPLFSPKSCTVPVSEEYVMFCCLFQSGSKKTGRASPFTKLLAVSITLSCLITEWIRKLVMVSEAFVSTMKQKGSCALSCIQHSALQCKCLSLIKKQIIQARDTAKIQSNNRQQCQAHTQLTSSVVTQHPPCSVKPSVFISSDLVEFQAFHMSHLFCKFFFQQKPRFPE